MPRCSQNTLPSPRTAFAVIFVLICGASIALAQVTTATFYGIVTDGSGAAIPRATAVLTNIETNQSQSKTADDSGEFTFDYIRVGQYALTIEAPGFKKYSARGYDLQAGQSVRRTFVLEVGNVTESVSVTAQTPLGKCSFFGTIVDRV